MIVFDVSTLVGAALKAGSFPAHDAIALASAVAGNDEAQIGVAVTAGYAGNGSRFTVDTLYSPRRLQMERTVDVTIPVEPETATILANPHNRETAGRILNRILRPRRDPDPLIELLEAIQEEARAAGLTEADVDEELAAYNAERRDG